MSSACGKVCSIIITFCLCRVIGPDSLKRIEIEILASSQGVVDFIDIINSIYTESSDSKVAKGKEVLSTLRIYDLEKVRFLPCEKKDCILL